MSPQEPIVHFHVGTGKTGTTFLQYRVFPYLKGLHYIQRTKYKKAIEIIRSGKAPKYLVSREFDQQLEEETRKFAEALPSAHPIIVFRRHESYIASQYRRFVKNGFRGGLDQFLDLQEDKGYFKKEDLNYMRQIKILENFFDHKPLVLIYEDMRKDSHAFINLLADKMEASIDVDRLNLNKKHSSYSEKQLKAIQFMGRFVDMTKKRRFKNGLLHFLSRLYMSILRYGTLYISKILPDSMFRPEALIDEDELRKIRDHYASDWQECLDYAKASQA